MSAQYWQEQKFWRSNVLKIEDIRARDPKTGRQYDVDSDPKFHSVTAPSPEEILIAEEESRDG